jgi:pyruvate formate lyase activating enzyme
LFPIPEFPLIGGYLPTSFLDWEGRVAAVVFLLGCNFRCPFCHNAPLATGLAEGIDPKPVLSDILRRECFLDGVVVSGGEPTLYARLAEMLYWFRNVAKLPVKLDTNGSHPEVLEVLLEDRLIDAVAMDIKAPWEKYAELAGVPVDTGRVRASLDLLKSRGVPLELRTTYVPGLLSIEDLHWIRSQLDGDPRWIVQLFQPANALDPALREIASPKRDEIASALQGVRVRG